MKKIAKWLLEHAVVLGSGEKDSVVHLWSIVISFLLTFIFVLLGWTKQPIYYLLMVLLLGGTVIPPIVAGIVAIITKTKWNPWYWFPIVIGNVIGTLITMIISYIFNLI